MTPQFVADGWTAFLAGLAVFYAFVPNLIGAALIVLVGWVLANVAYTVTDKVLDWLHFDRFMARIGLAQAISRSGVKLDPSQTVGTLVKWSVLLVSFMMAADALQLTQVSMGIGAILAYIPNVIAAAAILGLGLLLAGFVSRVVRGAAASANLSHSSMMADATYWAIAIFAGLGAIGQLNIAPALVQTIYTGVIAAVCLALGIAFGFGGRSAAQDVVAGRALAQALPPGSRIKHEDHEDVVAHVGAMVTELRGEDGKSHFVTNHELLSRSFSAKPSRLTVTMVPEPRPEAHIIAPGTANTELPPPDRLV